MENAYVNGTWKVNISATGGTQPSIGSEWTAFIRVKQCDDKVSGTFITEHGLTGKLTGQVSGDIVSMTINQGPVRPGTFQGISKVNPANNQMTGTYSGGDSGGTLQAIVVAHKMKYYEVALNKIKMTLSYSDPEDEKGIPLWFKLSIVLGFILFSAMLILVHHYLGPILYLGIGLIFVIYKLYQYFKDR